MAVIVLLLGALVAAPPAVASSSAENDFMNRINAERTARGLHPLIVAGDLRDVARAWSGTMSATGKLAHNPSLKTQVCCWTRITENVGYRKGSDHVRRLHQQFMDSSGHRSNILDSKVTEVGVGVVVVGDTMWVTQVFRGGNVAAAPAPKPKPSPTPTATATPAPSQPRASSTPPPAPEPEPEPEPVVDRLDEWKEALTELLPLADVLSLSDWLEVSVPLRQRYTLSATMGTGA